MILIPEQISFLRDQKERLKQQLELYRDYQQNREIVSSDHCSRTFIGDSLTEDQFHRNRQELQEITELLKNGDYLKERNFDSVGIGTKVLINFNDINETEAIILTDCIYGLSDGLNYASTNSLLGKSILGKKTTDTFEYAVSPDNDPRNKRKISGEILEIITDRKEYVHYIRERRTSKRMYEGLGKRLKVLAQEGTPMAQAELESYNTITHSQCDLLEMEKLRLSRNKDADSLKRLKNIKDIEKKPIAQPPVDGSIGVGSKIEIAMARAGEEVKTKNYELINQAVSDELDDAYIERISYFGQQLYGKKANETFSTKKDGKAYVVTILDVNNQNNITSEKAPVYNKK